MRGGLGVGIDAAEPAPIPVPGVAVVPAHHVLLTTALLAPLVVPANERDRERNREGEGRRVRSSGCNGERIEARRGDSLDHVLVGLGLVVDPRLLSLDGEDEGVDDDDGVAHR